MPSHIVWSGSEAYKTQMVSLISVSNSIAQFQTETIPITFRMQLQSAVVLLQALTATQVLAGAIPNQRNYSFSTWKII